MTRDQTSRPRVLLVGLDATEVTLIEKWIDRGDLPHLAALKQRGAFGRMGSTAELNGSPWVSFQTGVHPGDHGYHNFLLWNAQKMRHDRPNHDWPGTVPFWRDLSNQGPYTVAVDVPDTFPGENFHGFEIGSWAGHYLMCPTYTMPPDRAKDLQRRYGKTPMPMETAGFLTAQELLGIRDAMLRVTETQTKLHEELLQSEPWDLFITAYGTTHRAGHQLFTDTGVAGEIPSHLREAFDDALRQVYIAADAALGRMLMLIDDDTTVMVFACHGMTDNRTLATHLPEMVRRIVEDDDGSSHEQAGEAKPGLTKRLRNVVPLSWRSAVKNRLPQAWQDALTLFWRTSQENWAQTPVFCVLPDLQGFVRVNLVGRERDGIVQPGEEYEQWLQKVTEGLKTFVDDDTGEPIVARIKRPRDFYPQGKRNDALPDLIVDWPPRVAADFRSMSSPRYGRIRTMLDGKAPEGRSGHHWYDGWILIAGKHVEPGSTLEGVHALDLAPTLYALYGLTPPDYFSHTPSQTLLDTIRPGQPSAETTVST